MTTAIANARWVAVSQVGRVATQFIGVAVLARLLQPADYGLMALAGTVIMFAVMLRDMGTGAAIVQKKDLSERTVNAVFWLNMAMGAALSLILAVGAPLFAAAMRTDEVKWVLWALVGVFPITSSAIAHQSLLERRAAFKVQALIEVGSALAALALGVFAAWRGAGVWALVIQSIAGSVISSAAMWAASGWRPSRRADWSELRHLMRFSAHLAGFNFVNYLSRNVDAPIIGRFLGAAALGHYALAYKLMLFPLQNLTYVANRALLPVLSRRQDETSETAQLWLRTLRIIATFTAPLTAGMWVLREPIVALLFGAQWTLTAPVLAWLAPTAFLQSLTSTVGVVLTARGRTDLLLRIGLVVTALNVAAFVVGAQFGVEQVAMAYLVANLIAVPVSLGPVLRLLGIPARRLVEAIAKPLASAVLMVAAVHVLRLWLGWPTDAWKQQFVASGAFALLCYALAFVLIFRGDTHDVLLLVRRRRA